MNDAITPASGRQIRPGADWDLIDAGFLAKFRSFAPASPDLTEVRTIAGDSSAPASARVAAAKALLVVGERDVRRATTGQARARRGEIDLDHIGIAGFRGVAIGLEGF